MSEGLPNTNHYPSDNNHLEDIPSLEDLNIPISVLIDNSPDLITILDDNLRYVFCNETLKSILKQRNINNWFKKTSEELGYPESVTIEFEKHANEVLLDGNQVSYETKSWNLTDRYYKLTMVRLSTDTGHNYVMVVMRDITKKHESYLHEKESLKKITKINARLESANEQLRDLSYLMSHNLKEPVNNLYMLHELLRPESINNQSSIIWDNIDKSMYNLKDTLNSIYKITQLILSDDIDLKNIPIEKVYNKCVNSLGELIRSSNTSITYDFSECPKLLYHELYLESILQNLLSNAIKYKHKDRLPEIHIKSFILDQFAFIRVTDNGIGIDIPKHGDKIFALNRVINKRPDAKGIGLYLVKKQIESLDGHINVESVFGEGTSFTINLGPDKIPI